MSHIQFIADPNGLHLGFLLVQPDVGDVVTWVVGKFHGSLSRSICNHRDDQPSFLGDGLTSLSLQRQELRRGVGPSRSPRAGGRASGVIGARPDTLAEGALYVFWACPIYRGFRISKITLPASLIPLGPRLTAATDHDEGSPGVRGHGAHDEMQIMGWDAFLISLPHLRQEIYLGFVLLLVIEIISCLHLPVVNLVRMGEIDTGTTRRVRAGKLVCAGISSTRFRRF